ncbi:MAG: hypothetical protein IJP07_03775 [Firmicutes bacterium]|nr:hypothetical protein [Bacillota bacterium]
MLKFFVQLSFKKVGVSQKKAGKPPLFEKRGSKNFYLWPAASHSGYRPKGQSSLSRFLAGKLGFSQTKIKIHRRAGLQLARPGSGSPLPAQGGNR